MERKPLTFDDFCKVMQQTAGYGVASEAWLKEAYDIYLYDRESLFELYSGTARCKSMFP